MKKSTEHLSSSKEETIKAEEYEEQMKLLHSRTCPYKKGRTYFPKKRKRKKRVKRIKTVGIPSSSKGDRKKSLF